MNFNYLISMTISLPIALGPLVLRERSLLINMLQNWLRLERDLHTWPPGTFFSKTHLQKNISGI